MGARSLLLRVYDWLVAEDRGQLDSGPENGRLVSAGEIAVMLGVRESDVLGWIDRGLISPAGSQAGEARFRVIAEHAHNDGPFSSFFTRFDLGRGADPDSSMRFQQELQSRRRDYELEGLEYGGVDVEALTRVIAARLAAVVPPGTEVSVSKGMVVVGGSGIDVAMAMSDCERPAEALICELAGRALDIASESISESTAEPWPARAGQFRGAFPQINVHIVGGYVHWSYGDPDRPVLTLEPIELAAVLTQES